MVRVQINKGRKKDEVLYFGPENSFHSIISKLRTHAGTHCKRVDNNGSKSLIRKYEFSHIDPATKLRISGSSIPVEITREKKLDNTIYIPI